MKIRYTLTLISFILLTGCSFKTDSRYKYRVNASNSFDSFKTYYLQGKTRLASIALKRALQSAKSGADTNAIAKIYLGECALHNAMLIKDQCQEYKDIQDIVDDKTLQNYYYLITGHFDKIKIDKIPLSYKDFAKYVKIKNYEKAVKSIRGIDSIDSKLVAASLIKNHLSRKEIIYVINESASLGYKKAALGWYGFLKSKSTPSQIKKINQKIKLFNSLQ